MHESSRLWNEENIAEAEGYFAKGRGEYQVCAGVDLADQKCCKTSKIIIAFEIKPVIFSPAYFNKT